MSKLQAHAPWFLGLLGITAFVACSAGNDGEPPVGGSAGTTANSSGAASGGTSAAGSATAGSANTAAGSTGAGGTSATAGTGMGGSGVAGTASAGSASGGVGSLGGAGGSAAGGRGGSGGSGGGNSNPGTCTASKATGANATGSGTHKVTVETNADAGIKEGTIFRPTDLGGTEKYPIFVWGEGGCSQNGMDTAAAMAEIASHGYFVVADGVPKNPPANRPLGNDVVAMAKPLLAYVTWAIAENGKPCSAYFNSLDTTKVASNGFSCGGLMSEGTAADTRITTWGLNSSGLMGANEAFYKTVRTPVLMVLGGPSDTAYKNGMRDYDNISALGIPILLFSKDIGHGGDLFSTRGGDFTKINLAWLNWHLKGDMTATGKGLLVGAACSYCTNSAWEMKSQNIP